METRLESRESLNARVREESWFIPRIADEISKVIVGQKYLVDRLLIALLCNGHVLIEGVPGLAKTLSVKSLACTISAKFQRVQFTPDLLPADLVGTLVYNPQRGEFTTRKGPIFANIVLADEINRAPAKLQSALLEAMEERQVTIGETTFPLDNPFMVLATQNPIEQEGTYHLPEAQVDRFMLKVVVKYPSRKEERTIMDRALEGSVDTINEVIGTDAILGARALVGSVFVEDAIREYILRIVFATREPQNFGMGNLTSLISYGASPRASIYLAQAARAYALLSQRGYVTPEDVKSVAMDVLRHRVIITYEAEAEEMTSEDVVAQVLNTVDVP
ncbi:MAG: MoxR family ATPase [Dehalococcoidia bacterium]|nr:MoxR family ATPase [Dehalococcoidia bacterium]